MGIFFQKEFSEAYQSFADSLYSVMSGIHNNLLDEQLLHLTEDLTTLDMNELYKLVRIYPIPSLRGERALGNTKRAWVVEHLNSVTSPLTLIQCRIVNPANCDGC